MTRTPATCEDACLDLQNTMAEIMDLVRSKIRNGAYSLEALGPDVDELLRKYEQQVWLADALWEHERATMYLSS